MNFLQKIYTTFLNILYPIECLDCKKSDVWICEKCLQKIKLNKKGISKIDLLPSYLDGFLIASNWENKILQDVIHKFKYNFAQELSESLSQLIFAKLKTINADNAIPFSNFIIIPIPLHKKRYIWRGFNQSELLAEKISEKLNIPHKTKIISRIKNTKAQAKLGAEHRNKNMKDAFIISQKNTFDLNKAKILLIDDVITTGSTMNETARILKNAGASLVIGLAIARG